MRLPEKPAMKSMTHGSGAKGMAVYTYEDAAIDVIMDARRETGRHPFVEVWRYRWLPDGEFSTYSALRNAVETLGDDQIAEEKAKWPRLIEPPSLRLGGTVTHCWLHKDKPATHHGTVQESWYLYDVTSAIICAECAATKDGTAISQASARRIRDVAERHGK